MTITNYHVDLAAEVYFIIFRRISEAHEEPPGCGGVYASDCQRKGMRTQHARSTAIHIRLASPSF